MKQPEFGQKVAEYRKKQGLTQEELAEKCKMNVRSIQRIEAGAVNPRTYTIKLIAKVLEFEDEINFKKENSLIEILSDLFSFKRSNNNTKIQLYQNGKLMQDSSTSKFIFKVEHVISYISKSMTLNPGDVITTGTPPGIGPMKSGDTIEVKIEGIGTLKNYVK